MIEHHFRDFVADKLNIYMSTGELDGGTMTLVLIVISLAIALICFMVAHHVFVRFFNHILLKTNKPLAECVTNNRVFEKLSILTPLLVLNIFIPIAISHYDILSTVIDRILAILILLVILWMVYCFLDAVNDLATYKGITRRMPIKSFVQLIKLFTFFIGVIVTISILANEAPVILFSGLGVATGFVMLVFKDTILGFVAGIQLSANRMVSLNDWIQMDSYGANGTVEEISLTTIKVRNFDNTVSMLPAYALVQNAFINWQGMSDSGGRRITRSVNLDVTSIRFVSKEEVEELTKLRLLRQYIFEKSKEMDDYNQSLEQDDLEANQRKFTNIGLFRAYLNAYLHANKDIHQYMLIMVRQLQPTPEGIPLQIYGFTNTTDWGLYEGIQSDLFDHIYAIMPLFGLRPFQQLTSHDFTASNSSHSSKI
ncbi:MULTISPECIES: mechanosensitive ion channel family protein [Vibrio]|uniref:Mechanosensitive ion channel family protein n=2 Tax=Vibrio mediterranei TaxID=689 RepID=A0A3G4VKA4_9VIBR|nr:MULTISPECIES: mechanosensitive ion channel family protein [Vibrio]AYV24032.1 mechanosensitive ion channel family protein [Vibrio mediterranei]EDL55925.1 mechanosensitive ion channel [Vibrio mediterranei AK1]KFA97390.1 mechanosensitive ion channel protein MscS [Vibrio sp. ER1A]MCF4173743.1 mechanosensitive ion channel family protein [Vibrio sp. McD22-P3]MCY9852488.1 mechanosensitive ion channel family protein [Vibrio mediterranei]